MGSFHNPDDEAVDEELYQAFLNAHADRLRTLRVPECKWKTLCKKLCSSIFDAGNDFLYAQDDVSEDEDPEVRVIAKCSMDPEDEEHIYLIDHAWTYTVFSAKEILEGNANLIQRMANIMKISNRDNLSDPELIKHIMDKMWQFNNCYIIQQGNQGPRVTCWYILDEFGSSIHYSDDPNFEIVPFFYGGDRSMYSLLYPKSHVDEGDEITVLFPGCDSSLSPEMKKALKYPWISSDFSDIDFNLSEPPLDYFASGRQPDVLPEKEWIPPLFENSPEHCLTVYSDFSCVIEFLKHPAFKIVDDKKEANILWLSTGEYNMKDLIKASPNFCYISQFPSEHVLINKDLLAAVCRRNVESVFNADTLESYPEWLPTTFNLKSEMCNFISFFQNRKERNMENIWICKPFNLARGIDIYVTDNLSQIIRLSSIHSMVACRYISDPVLFPLEERGLVKIDLRYIVLLKSIDPLELYIYDRFWIRFANKSFALEDFDDYERHFTVMNYSNFPLRQMYCHDFIQQFEDHYRSHKWSDIQNKINKMIKGIFVAATLKEAPAGLGHFSGSRAVYGLDLMLKWDRNHDVPEIKPMILEVNWMPDCKRACQYYPEFYNDIFSVLFLGNTEDKHVTLL